MEDFIAPVNFAEFFDRFPDHVRSFVRRRVHRRDRHDDLTQDLLLHLSTLPAGSIHRPACTDVIQTYRSDPAYDNPGKHFFGWLKRVMSNKLQVLMRGERHDWEILDRELSAGHHSHVESILVHQFRTYVRKYNPELVPLIDAIQQDGDWGLGQSTRQRARYRLAMLYRCFRAGEEPSRQGRPRKAISA